MSCKIFGFPACFLAWKDKRGAMPQNIYVLHEVFTLGPTMIRFWNPSLWRKRPAALSFTWKTPMSHHTIKNSFRETLCGRDWEDCIVKPIFLGRMRAADHVSIQSMDPEPSSVCGLIFILKGREPLKNRKGRHVRMILSLLHNLGQQEDWARSCFFKIPCTPWKYSLSSFVFHRSFW